MTSAMPAIHAPPYQFLRRTLSWLRWTTIAVLLMLTLIQPRASHVGAPTWALVVVFAGSTFIVELLRRRFSAQPSFAWTAILDLPVAGILYALGAESGGPLFILFFLAVDAAAASMAPRGTLLYTGAAVIVAGAIDAVPPLWSSSGEDVVRVGTRLVMLAVVGVGMAIVMRRLALEQAVAQSVRDEAERLEALDQLRTDFLATFSHDLRTPLTATRTALRLIEISAADRLRPDEQALLENGRRNNERLGLLIDDLLAFNQLTAGTLHLEREALDLRDVARETLSIVAPLFQEKGQTVDVDLPEPLPVEGDQQRLEQVLVNLLANAHRHTPRGTRIVLRGWVTADAVRLLVHDNGSGIPPAEQEAIFLRFYRLTSSADAIERGSGLGLAIAKGIIELHGGRIWVESKPGEGTAFSVALPPLRAGGVP